MGSFESAGLQRSVRPLDTEIVRPFQRYLSSNDSETHNCLVLQNKRSPRHHAAPDPGQSKKPCNTLVLNGDTWLLTALSRSAQLEQLHPAPKSVLIGAGCGTGKIPNEFSGLRLTNRSHNFAFVSPTGSSAEISSVPCRESISPKNPDPTIATAFRRRAVQPFGRRAGRPAAADCQ
jgi:hypothetical protein